MFLIYSLELLMIIVLSIQIPSLKYQRFVFPYRVPIPHNFGNYALTVGRSLS